MKEQNALLLDLATEGIYSNHNHGCLYTPPSQHRPGTQGTVQEYNGAFPLAWYGTVRHGSVRYVAAQFGSVCVSTAV